MPRSAPAGNALSRAVEARADAFALELTEDPDAMIRVERRLATQNLADPNPPRWRTLLLATHPATITRIGYAVSWQRGQPAARANGAA